MQQARPYPRWQWLWWLMSAYLGSVIGVLGGSDWPIRNWTGLAPFGIGMGLLVAIVTPGPNLILGVCIVTAIVLDRRQKYVWSLIVTFLGCAFVQRSMLAVWTAG